MPPSTQARRFLRFSDFELDLESGKLRRDGVALKLQPQPFKVLALLVAHPGEVVTREQLRSELWGDETFVDFEQGLNFCIRQIRAVLNDDAKSPLYIETLPRRGYRLIVPAEPPTEILPAAVRPAAVMPGIVPRVGWLVRWFFLCAVVVMLTAAVGFLAWRRVFSGARQPETKYVVAVLPFTNLSGQPEQDYFSDSLTDDLITELGSLHPERLRVIARTSAMSYKNATEPPDRIGHALGARFVVEGSVRRSGDFVRINVELVDVNTQTHLWARSYERQLHDVMAVQGEVARDISSGIQLTLTPQAEARLAHRQPTDPKAYEAYLRGRYFWNKRTEEGLQRARSYFEQAIEDDPGYALAYAGLADAYIELGEYGVLPLKEAMPRAKAAAAKALEIDDELAEAHTSLGAIHCDFDWDWPAAEREFKRANELNPAYATAHQWYAEYLLWMGRFEESKAEMKRAQELDPLSPIINRNLGLPFFLARQYDEAITHFRKTLEVDPMFWANHFMLGWAYEEKRDYSRAIAEYETARRVHDSPLTLAHLGHVHAVSGRKREARMLLANLLAESKRRYVPSASIAMVYEGLGDRDQAFEWLEKGFEERSDWMVQLRVDPRWDTMRSDARFQNLLRRVGL